MSSAVECRNDAPVTPSAHKLLESVALRKILYLENHLTDFNAVFNVLYLRQFWMDFDGVCSFLMGRIFTFYWGYIYYIYIFFFYFFLFFFTNSSHGAGLNFFMKVFDFWIFLWDVTPKLSYNCIDFEVQIKALHPNWAKTALICKSIWTRYTITGLKLHWFGAPYKTVTP